MDFLSSFPKALENRNQKCYNVYKSKLRGGESYVHTCIDIAFGVCYTVMPQRQQVQISDNALLACTHGSFVCCGHLSFQNRELPIYHQRGLSALQAFLAGKVPCFRYFKVLQHMLRIFYAYLPAYDGQLSPNPQDRRSTVKRSDTRVCRYDRPVCVAHGIYP